MAANAKLLENMTKNLLLDERVAREKAEIETLPARDTVQFQIPSYVRKNAAAKKHWEEILARMDGILLLDDLDSEMLGVYCVMLTRHEELSELCRLLMKDVGKARSGIDARLAATERVESLLLKLQNHERTLLQYAEKLGLTPSGRIRLARSRAAAYVASENDDLFGE